MRHTMLLLTVVYLVAPNGHSFEGTKGSLAHQSYCHSIQGDERMKAGLIEGPQRFGSLWSAADCVRGKDVIVMAGGTYGRADR